MEIQSAFASGLQGYQRASAGVTEATVDINRQTQTSRQTETEQAVRETDASQQQRSLQAATEQPRSVTDSLVKLNTEEANAEANVRSIQAADEVLGTVIDIRV